MGKRYEGGDGVSRRGFLKRALIGVGGGMVVLAGIGGKWLPSAVRRRAAEFPDDSIFAPARKQRRRS